MVHSCRYVARALVAMAVSLPALAYADTPAPPAPMVAVSTSRADHVDTGLYAEAVTAWTDAYARTVWYLAVAEQNRPRPRQRPHGTRSGPAVYGTGACGGDLPSCSVMMCESGGSLTAQNPRSTASGKWQILDSTWGGYGGYDRASSAPEDVQDARAREIYAGGAGRRAWVC